MKLVDLNPHWAVVEGARVGVTFDCPGRCCASATFRERIYVPFRNPIGGGDSIPGDPRWNRTGDTFETLTLTPSVDASNRGHWHGFVTAGGAI